MIYNMLETEETMSGIYNMLFKKTGATTAGKSKYFYKRPEDVPQTEVEEILKFKDVDI